MSMEQTPAPEVHDGLKGVIAAKTQVAEVDGKNGKLTLRGYDISELSGTVEFEEVCYLLWYGKLPNRAEYDALRAEMAAARELPEETIQTLRICAPKADGMDYLRIGAATLTIGDPTVAWPINAPADVEGNRHRAARLQAQVAAIVAHGYRLGEGLDIVQPKKEHSLAQGFLYMLEGEEPSAARVAGLNAYLVAVAEHGFNASTFAGRVIQSTNSDMVSALTGAIGALKGWLHGGVPGPVLDMLDAIGSEENAQKWISDALDRKERIMGFGHRVYQVRDPRAALLSDACERLAKETGENHLLELTKVVEEVTVDELEKRKPGNKLRANVELYAALILHAVGVPSEIFTPIFAIGRTSGWTAHMLEHLPKSLIIRPESIYDGPKGKTFVPIDERE
ncbi:MAG: citrate/2-methylcitrate synthase [Armatimonas sp.]